MKNTRCAFKTASSFLKAEQRQMNDITAKGKTQEDFAYGQKG